MVTWPHHLPGQPILMPEYFSMKLCDALAWLLLKLASRWTFSFHQQYMQLQQCQWDLRVPLQPQRGSFSLLLGRACRSRRWDEDIKWQNTQILISLLTSCFPAILCAANTSTFCTYRTKKLDTHSQTWRWGQMQRWLYILGGYIRSSFDSDKSHCQWLLRQLFQKKCSRVRRGEDLYR